MFKKTITYKDFNDVERTEVFYFNFTESELIEMQLGEPGGLDQTLSKIVAGLDTAGMISFFKKFVLEAYGEKSADGKRFIKNDELREAFSQTNAYNKLFMELAFDDVAAAEFINGVIPKDVADKMPSIQRNNA